MKVKRGERSNTFCGPAALSLLTGKHVDTCVKEVHARRYFDRPVRSMDKDEITQTLYHMGFSTNTRFHYDISGFGRRWVRGHKPTLVALVRWLKRQEHYSSKKKYLIMVTGHYMVMQGIKIFDNTNPEGVFFGKYNRRRRRVGFVWEVTRRASCPVPAESFR